jgi:hypothetical protein
MFWKSLAEIVLVTTGIATLTVGLWWWWPVAALVVLGLCLITTGVLIGAT